MKATLSFHMHFPPIENHYKEQFNVSGLLNEDSDMKKKKVLLNHNSLLLKGFSYILYFLFILYIL